MIITNLKGGLGNQMFQYALGRKLSLHNNDQIKLDISGYPRQNLRSYRLDAFNIVENIARAEEIKKFKYPYGILSMAWRRFSFKILRRFHIGWEPRLLAKLEKKQNVYLDGFWQSYRYLEDVVDVIKKDFTLKEPLEKVCPELIHQIEATNSISLHIRRGDYVADTKTQKHHGSCSLDYYRQAVDLVAKKVVNPTFFIFSDGIDWVKNNLSISHPVIYVSNPELQDYHELILMSLCHHNIIANSSFSWWGAWLNDHSDKIVISPSRWVNNNSVKIDDLIPPTWIKI